MLTRLTSTKVLLIVLALSWSFAGLLYARYKGEQARAHRLAEENLRLEVREEALADSLRLVGTFGGRELYERMALPDTDSLLGAVRAEMRREIEEQHRELLGTLQFRYRADSARIASEVLADAGSTPDSLSFQIDDKDGPFRVRAGLHVNVPTRRLTYDLSVVPDPMDFGVYATERDGRIEVWLDVDGEVTQLKSFVRPPVLLPPPPSRLTLQAFTGLDLTADGIEEIVGASASYRLIGPIEGALTTQIAPRSGYSTLGVQLIYTF